MGGFKYVLKVGTFFYEHKLCKMYTFLIINWNRVKTYKVGIITIYLYNYLII